MKRIQYFKSFMESADYSIEDDYRDARTFTDEDPYIETDDSVYPESEDKEDLGFEEAKDWIVNNLSEEKVINMFENAIMKYVDHEQMEAEGYEQSQSGAYDYYLDYGSGEAQSDVTREIINMLKSNFNLLFDELAEETNLYEFLRRVFPCLEY